VGRCIWAGTAASVLIVAGGIIVGPGASSHGPALRLAGYAASYAGIVTLVGAWLYLGRALARSPGTPSSVVLGALVAWGLPMLCGPVLFSRDIFSYAAQGREIVVGINPYHHGPAALGGGAYLPYVSRMWADARSPYGPFFLGIDALIVRHAGQHVMVAVGRLRLLACAGVALLAVALPRLASSCGADPSSALWLGVLNPLMLLHVVSGGHNEGLMLGLMVAGLACAREGRFAAGLVLCLVAATVKMPAAVGALYVGADWIRSCPDGLARARATLRLVATALATAVTLTAAAGLGWGWLGTVTTPTRVKSALSVTTDIGQAAGKVLRGLGAGVPAGWALSTARLVGLGAALALAGLLLASGSRRPSAAGVGLTLLAVVALGPVIQPWYVLWGMVPLAAAGPGRFRPVLIYISAGLCLLVLPDGRAVTGLVMVGFMAGTGAVSVMSYVGGTPGWPRRPVRRAGFT